MDNPTHPAGAVHREPVVDDLAGARVLAPDDSELGVVDAVVPDRVTGQPSWAAVTTTDEQATVVIPLANTVTEDTQLRVPFSAETVLAAPSPRAATAPDDEEHQQLVQFYGAYTNPEPPHTGWVPPAG